MTGSSGQDQKLYTPDDARPWRIMTRRAILIALILAGTFAFVWLHRHDIVRPDGAPAQTTDVFVYVSENLLMGEAKDLDAATPWARLADAVGLSIVKVALLLIVFETAYEVLAKRIIEWIKMTHLKARLRDHTLICGFGPEGQAAAQELLARGIAPDDILPIDNDTERLEIATKMGLHGLRGDPVTRETLEDASALDASAAIICTGRDDANLLAVLAFRALNTKARVIASVTDPNNATFVKNGGANFVLTHASVAGILMADGVVSAPTANALLDLLSAGGDMELMERDARESEVGKKIVEIDDTPAIQILRNGEVIGFWDDVNGIVQPGDKLVVVRHSTPKIDGEELL